MASPIRCGILLGLLMMGAKVSPAQVALPSGPPGIWIADATGELQPVQPVGTTFLVRADDVRLQLVLSVETFAHSAAGALSAGRLAVTRLRSAFSQTPVATEGVTSELAYVEPRYRQRLLAGSWEKPRRLGYDAGFVVTVEVPATADVGRLVDAAMAAGATRVLSLAPVGVR